MAYQSLIFQRQDEIAYLTLDRPEAGNAINLALAEELAEVCQRANEDGDIRVVVVTGSGESFSSGGEVTEREKSMPSSIASEAVARINAPVIAAINGDALGAGLELALACDIRIAAEGSKFGLHDASYGFIPAGGGTQRLPRIVGRGKALEMILTAEIIDAQEAYRVGLVNGVVPLPELSAEVEGMARKLASKGPIAERYAKEAIAKGLDMSLDQGLRLEADLSFLLQSTKDRSEGIDAFMEKRTAQFEGE